MKAKPFYKTLTLLALPIVVQSMVSACLGMVDTMMLGSLGDAAIAAVGLANQYFFTFAMIIIGLGSGCSLFIAQYFGKNDVQGMRSVVTVTLRFVALFCVPFTLITLLAPEWIIRCFSRDAELVALGAAYLRVIALTIPPFALSSVFAASLRSIRRTAAPMWASIIALFLNAGLNYVLIFGKLGFPKMGVYGAAVATLIARVAECVLLLAIAYGGKTEIAVGLRAFRHVPPGLTSRFLRASSHMILNDWLYGFAATIYMIAYAHLGKQVLASLNVAGSIQNVLFTVIGGIATASAILVGGEAGQNRMKEAFSTGRLCLRFTVAVGAVNAVLLFLISPVAPRLFSQTADTYAVTVSLIRIYALVLVVRFVNFVVGAGILRGGGDTRWTMILELSTVWLIAVPLAFLGVYAFRWNIERVVLLVMLEEFVKCVLMLKRFYRHQWMKNMTQTTECEGELI